jgi:hypothetical protein
MVKVFKDFITPQEQKKINETILSPRWKWGYQSDPNPNRNTLFNEVFWQITALEKESFYSIDLLNKIKDTIQEEVLIERIYMNGHLASGQGNMHKDSEKDNGRTFLIYCNEDWHPELGGGTSFVNNGEITTYYPHPYSAIYFQNNINHFAAPLSRMFNGLRVTLAFKLFKI